MIFLKFIRVEHMHKCAQIDVMSYRTLWVIGLNFVYDATTSDIKRLAK
jgi:hypothetical protein